MSTYPSWAIALVAALEEHEDVHPAADSRFGDPHWCVQSILNAVPAEVRSYVAAWKDGFEAAKPAEGGILTADMLRRARGQMLGEPEGFPRQLYNVSESDAMRFGDHEIRVVEHPSMPEDLVIAVGSCVCGHPVGGHSENGCFTPGAGTGAPCPCATPLSRLVAMAKIATDSAAAPVEAETNPAEETQ